MKNLQCVKFPISLSKWVVWSCWTKFLIFVETTQSSWQFGFMWLLFIALVSVPKFKSVRNIECSKIFCIITWSHLSFLLWNFYQHLQNLCHDVLFDVLCTIEWNNSGVWSVRITKTKIFLRTKFTLPSNFSSSSFSNYDLVTFVFLAAITSWQA